MNQLLSLKKAGLLTVLASLAAILFLFAACDATPEPDAISPIGHWEYLSWIGAGELPVRLNNVTGEVEVDIDRRDIVFLEDGTGWKISIDPEEEEDYFFTWFIDDDGVLVVEETFWDMFYYFNITPHDHFGFVLELTEEPGWYSLVRNFRIVE